MRFLLQEFFFFFLLLNLTGTISLRYWQGVNWVTAAIRPSETHCSWKFSCHLEIPQSWGKHRKTPSEYWLSHSDEKEVEPGPVSVHGGGQSARSPAWRAFFYTRLMTYSALAELWGCQGWFNWAELNLSQETNRDRERKGKNLWSWSIKPIRPFDLDRAAYFARDGCDHTSVRMHPYVWGLRKVRLPATSQTNSQKDLSFLFQCGSFLFVFHPVLCLVALNNLNTR